MEVSKNQNPNSSSSSSSVRVKVRSSSSSATSSDPSTSSASNGVVVVGFIGHRADITTNLINRVVDSNVFGSGNLDNNLCIDSEELRVADWFRQMRLSYHRDDLNGIVFLHFASCSGGEFRCGSAIEEEEHDFKYLQGMLFMFSVCHVIVYIQDGSRFDTQLLKKFRVLQAAKNGLVPFVRSHITTGFPRHSRVHSASQASHATSSAPPASSNRSPGKNRSLLSRSGSSMSVPSSLGSNVSLFPGQCTPVMLFVFMDDFSDSLNPSSGVEESMDTSASQNQASSSGLSRPNLPAKVSSPVVVLSRSVNKSEGGFRKKLQSSMEAQIRFLIKRCRTLSGSESSHGGPRSGGVGSSSVPLFSLDSSRAVVLLDTSINRSGESLEYATRLVEDVLNGKATSDSLLLESHGQISDKEDLASVKDFIYRQSDILRGRGATVANSNSGSAGGVGMVAVAAAAAAASASASSSSGKTFTALELPQTEVWLSSCQIILNGILSAKGGCLSEIEISKRKPRPRNAIPPTSEAVSSKAKDPLDMAVSWLESGKGLNTRFSTSWCERTLPAAKDVYLKDLPACYPTSVHEAHIEKALHAFHSMVKGSAVQQFAQKLEEECTAVWKSGRQLCDAVSLTGKPCMHQIHDLQPCGLISGSEWKPHCSGYVFLHACACGRSRKLRLDPFDFGTANNTSCYADCDKLLPALQLPKFADAGPVQPSAWRLIRVGGAKYYDPSKGLLQSGFCVTQKFLSKWEIFVEEDGKSQNDFVVVTDCLGSEAKSLNVDAKFEAKVVTDKMSSINLQSHSAEVHSGFENRSNLSKDVKHDEKIINFGNGLPNFTMRKPFAEVVAGSATGYSGFPPLQKKKQLLSNSDRNNIKQSKTRDLSLENTAEHQGSQKSSPDIINGNNTHHSTNGNPYLCIGSKVIPVNQNSDERIQKNPSFTHVAVYVGFEHECPHGHRFLLNPQHLNELGNLYQLPEKSQVSPVDISDQGHMNPSRHNNDIRQWKGHQISNRANTNGPKKERNGDRSKEVISNGYPTHNRTLEFAGKDKEQNHFSFGISKQDLHGSLDRIFIDNGGQAFSMLNRNLPIYMNCPHCMNSKNSKELPKAKFAGTISQLQRIFVVTPPYPIVVATCPLIQFEASSLHSVISIHEQKLQFSLGNEVILPPESFLALQLPFVYGVETEDRGVESLKYFEHQPEATAWIMKGTALRIVSRINSTAGQPRSQKT